MLIVETVSAPYSRKVCLKAQKSTCGHFQYISEDTAKNAVNMLVKISSLFVQRYMLEEPETTTGYCSHALDYIAENFTGMGGIR